MPRVLAVDPKEPQPEVIREAARVLAGGGLVAFPTETVYGLGARGLRPEEVARIFAAKGRPRAHPLILHVADVAMARSLAADFTAEASLLASRFWPGPLTLVVPRAPSVPDAATGGLDSVGIRAPAHPVALALIAAAGEPLAAPSANAHLHVSPTTAAHVVRSLGDAVDLVLDGGPSARGIESTVLDVTGPVPTVLRPGAVSLEALRAALPTVAWAASTVTEADAKRASPGLAAKHYAPRTRVELVPGAEVGSSLSRALGDGVTVAAITWSAPATASVRALAPRVTRAISMPGDAEGYAAALFAALHDADAADVGLLVVEAVPDDAAWWAVRDRLARAAHA